MNKVDLVILIVVAVFMFLGYKRGLIGTILNFFQYVIILFLSIKLSPMVSNILIKTFKLDAVILDWVYSNPDVIKGVISSLSDTILQNVVGRIISVISFILLFIVLKLIISIIISIINKIAEIPIVNEVNKLGGIILGAIEGVMIVYICILVINWLPLSQVEPIKNMVVSSKAGSLINNFVPTAATEILELSGIKQKK